MSRALVDVCACFASVSYIAWVPRAVNCGMPQRCVCTACNFKMFMSGLLIDSIFCFSEQAPASNTTTSTATTSTATTRGAAVPAVLVRVALTSLVVPARRGRRANLLACPATSGGGGAAGAAAAAAAAAAQLYRCRENKSRLQLPKEAARRATEYHTAHVATPFCVSYLYTFSRQHSSRFPFAINLAAGQVNCSHVLHNIYTNTILHSSSRPCPRQPCSKISIIFVVRFAYYLSPSIN